MFKKKIGILDPNGKKKNPLTNKPYSDFYKQYATEEWSKLPIYKNVKEIINTINYFEEIDELKEAIKKNDDKKKCIF